MVGDIKQWLEELGLGRYAQAFAENDIDLRALPHLSDDDLKELGLSLGHRRILQGALNEQNETRQPATINAPEDTAKTSAVQEAERRQLTVLFCDLDGSTELSSNLDPEDMREVLRAYQAACSEVIDRYEGYVAKFMGDGVYAYFGYPTAHEDDAERAINAGLGIVEAVAGLEQELAVRIGVATGNVAVGDLIGEGASEEANIVGEAPNLAARLQAIAEPNTVVIGEATHMLASGMFETTDLGAQNLKGFSDPVSAWRVLRASTSESRFQATRGEHLTELIGREEEFDTLLRRWQRAKSGEGQVVLISGEPGIGKSRLAQALQDKLISEPHTRLRYQCSPYHTNSALHPIIEQFERVAGFEAGDSPDVKLNKLEAALAKSGRPVDDTARLIASLLSIPTDDRYPALNVSAQRQKELTLNALVDQLAGLAEQQPVLFVFEDAHWIDPTTLELLESTVERVPHAAVLMVITHRPEFDAPWVGRPRVTPIILNRLESRDCARMVENVAKEFGITEEIRDRIVTQTDGVPLFIEELTKSVLETTTDSVAEIQVPSTLQDSLEARLDRLGNAREIAQIGAVIGRSFNYDLLKTIARLDEEALNYALEALVKSGLATARGAPPNSKYTFKHALVQETAYASLLRDRKNELHGQVAKALKLLSSEGTKVAPEIIGFHFAEAGKDLTAARYFCKAGEAAYTASSVKESLAHVSAALDLLKKLPEERETLEIEADLQRVRGLALIAMQGVGSGNAFSALERSVIIGQGIGKSNEAVQDLITMANMEAAQGKFEDATKKIETVLELSRNLDSRDVEYAANFVQGIIRFHSGKTSLSEKNFRRCIEYSSGTEADNATKHPLFEFRVGPRFRLGNALLIEGFPDQARILAEEAVIKSRATMPLAITSAMNYGCFTLIGQGNTDEALEWAEEGMKIADEHDFAQHSGWSRVNLGWANAKLGNCSRGLETINEGIELFKSGGRKTWLAWLLIIQSDAYLLCEDADFALACADKALDSVNEIGEFQFLSPAVTMRGRSLSMLDQLDVAEDCYRHALDIARDRAGKWWELRASTHLARLWQSQGKTTEARDLLAPVYGCFTEGFDTTDLKEAKTLLDELS